MGSDKCVKQFGVLFQKIEKPETTPSTQCTGVLERFSFHNNSSIMELDQSAHIRGNYHKYYTFHSVKSRLDLIEERNVFLNLWKAQKEPAVFTLLDIGCNEGDLSYAILQQARSELPSNVTCKMVGVDIDISLIQLANSKYAHSDSTIVFKAVDFMNSAQIDEFKQTMSTIYGITSFHFVSVFSTTMWIHLNGGDEGLEAFLFQAQRMLPTHIGGVLLIEPQPKKCYKSAAKRCRKLALTPPPYLNSVDKNNAETTLLNILEHKLGYKHHHYLGTEDWGRPLYLFYFPDQIDFQVTVQ